MPATVTNDIFTREDQEFLIKNKALPPSRIQAIETGGCPHAAIREDISANMGALETLQAKFGCQLLFVESGGDNLAANYSRELADYIIYVIDVSVSLFLRAFWCSLVDTRVAIRFLAKVVQVSPNPTSLWLIRYGNKRSINSLLNYIVDSMVRLIWHHMSEHHLKLWTETLNWCEEAVQRCSPASARRWEWMM